MNLHLDPYLPGKPRYIETLADSTLNRIIASLDASVKSQGFATAEQQDRIAHYQRELNRRKRLHRKQGVMP